MGLYFYNVVGLEYIALKDGLTFGRNKAEQNFPDDGRMSGLHAKVHVKVEGNMATIHVEDLNSKNRTSVDRMEIEPYQLQKVLRNSVVEMGDQKFILTDSTNLDIQYINQVMERYETKQVVKLEGRRLVQDIQNKVAQKVEELKSEQRLLLVAIDEMEKRIKGEKDKIAQVDVQKDEFVKKQEQERKEYFLKLDVKILGFQKEIEKFDAEKAKLQEKNQTLEAQIAAKAERVIKKDE